MNEERAYDKFNEARKIVTNESVAADVEYTVVELILSNTEYGIRLAARLTLELPQSEQFLVIHYVTDQTNYVGAFLSQLSHFAFYKDAGWDDSTDRMSLVGHPDNTDDARRDEYSNDYYDTHDRPQE